MSGTMSLRARVVAGLGAVAIVLVAAAALITSTTRAHLVDQVDDQLEEAIDPSRDRGFAAPDREPPPEPPDGTERPELPERLSPMFEAFVRDDGELTVFFESNLPGQEFSAPVIDTETIADTAGVPFTVESVDGETSYRVLAIDAPDGVFVRALPLADVDDTIGRLVLYEVLGIAAVCAALAAVAWWVIRLGIRPIRAMTDAAGDITDDDLSVRLPTPPEGATEAAVLAATLNTMLDRLERANQDRSASEDRLRRFVSDASHELRTPVTTIQGYAELYEVGGLGDRQALDDAMRRTGQEAARMARLVDDMLTLAKLDQQRPLDATPVDLAELITDISADVVITAPDHEVSTDLEGADAGRLVIDGDEDRLRQVFANVIRNAAVHTPAGTSIEIAARAGDGEVVVTVADDGPGVARQDLERLTERFYRADTSRSRRQGGSGLGLAIVAASTEAHGGTISIDSEVDRGTVVELRFPSAPTG